jgi:hypothetical protein
MADVWLFYVPETVYRRNIHAECSPSMNHVVVCDAKTGCIHVATEMSDRETPSTKGEVWPVGRFDSEKLVYIQYRNGHQSDIEDQLDADRFSKAEREIVRKASAHWSAKHPLAHAKKPRPSGTLTAAIMHKLGHRHAPRNPSLN